MKRIKRVFNSAQTCHVWAAQTQDDGRNTQNNIYFNGTEIYSYGSHYLMAKIYPENNNTVLINEKSYSSTTSGHRSHCADAVTHLKSFYVSDPSDPKASIISMGDKRIEDLFDTLKQNRPYLSEPLNDFFKEHNELCDIFKLKSLKIKMPKDVNELIMGHVDHRLKRNKELDKDKEFKRAESRASTYVIDKAEDLIARQKNKRNLESWLKGSTNVMPWFFDTPNDLDLLRVKNNKIETTGGADVPLKQGLKLLGLIESGNVSKGQKIGHFEFDELDNNIVIIGCHRIDLNHAKEVLSPYKGAALELVR